jgi:hypothetical protein
VRTSFHSDEGPVVPDHSAQRLSLGRGSAAARIAAFVKPDSSSIVRLSALRNRSAVVVLVLIAMMLVPLLGRVLQVDRGVDATDEAYYILSSTAPAGSPGYLFPFQWFLHPVYQLFAQDLAAVRTAAAVTLVLLGAALGRSVALTSLARTGAGEGAAVARIDAWFVVLSAAVVATATLLYYSSFLRTPSYNTLNLVALMLAGLSLSSVVRSAVRGQNPTVSAATLLSLGVVIGATARPTTSLLGSILIAIIVLTLHGVRPTLQFSIRVAAILMLLVGVLTASGVWPLRFWEAFLRFFASPSVSSGSVRGAFIAYPEALRRYSVSMLGQRPIALVSLALAVAGLALLTKFSREVARPAHFLIATGVAILSVAPLTVLADLPFPFIQAAVPSRSVGWADRGVTRAVMTLVFATATPLAISALRGLRASSRRGDVRRRSMQLLLYGGLLGLALLFGFGSTNGIDGMTVHAAGIAFAAAVAGIGRLAPLSRLTMTACLLVASSLLVAQTFLASKEAPYRLEPLSTHTEAVALLPRDQTPLLVDPATAAYINETRQVFAASGWREGTPLLAVMAGGLGRDWASLEPLILGAALPESHLLTTYGFPNSVDVARFHLARLDPNVWAQAWVLADSRTTDISPQVREVEGLLSLATGLEFPLDYRLVGRIRSGDSELEVYAPDRRSR